jgi:hypothetical protein
MSMMGMQVRTAAATSIIDNDADGINYTAAAGTGDGAGSSGLVLIGTITGEVYCLIII